MRRAGAGDGREAVKLRGLIWITVSTVHTARRQAPVRARACCAGPLAGRAHRPRRLHQAVPLPQRRTHRTRPLRPGDPGRVRATGRARIRPGCKQRRIGAALRLHRARHPQARGDPRAVAEL